MTDSTDTGTFLASNLSAGAGATLRAARERAGLRLDEVAVKTRIPLHVLEAIEHDDTAKLGQPVYVRGYLRKYAAAMNLQETQVLTAFDANAMKPPLESTRMAEEQVVDAPAAGSRAIIWVLLAVILAAIAGGAVLYIRGWGPASVHRKPALPRTSVVQPQPAPKPAPTPVAPPPAPEATPQPESSAPPADAQPQGQQ